jgi:hypothetical protein
VSQRNGILSTLASLREAKEGVEWEGWEKVLLVHLVLKNIEWQYGILTHLIHDRLDHFLISMSKACYRGATGSSNIF